MGHAPAGTLRPTRPVAARDKELRQAQQKVLVGHQVGHVERRPVERAGPASAQVLRAPGPRAQRSSARSARSRFRWPRRRRGRRGAERPRRSNGYAGRSRTRRREEISTTTAAGPTRPSRNGPVSSEMSRPADEGSHRTRAGSEATAWQERQTVGPEQARDEEKTTSITAAASCGGGDQRRGADQRGDPGPRGGRRMSCTRLRRLRRTARCKARRTDRTKRGPGADSTTARLTEPSAPPARGARGAPTTTALAVAGGAEGVRGRASGQVPVHLHVGYCSCVRRCDLEGALVLVDVRGYSGTADHACQGCPR